MTPEVPGCMFEVSLVTPGNLDQSLEFGSRTLYCGRAPGAYNSTRGNTTSRAASGYLGAKKKEQNHE
jgi:hypothetical protein